eukprot:6208601-Pleurochrysis_carterae.AAC.1
MGRMYRMYACSRSARMLNASSTRVWMSASSRWKSASSRSSSARMTVPCSRAGMRATSSTAMLASRCSAVMQASSSPGIRASSRAGLMITSSSSSILSVAVRALRSSSMLTGHHPATKVMCALVLETTPAIFRRHSQQLGIMMMQ